jgi:hypothetical protein
MTRDQIIAHLLDPRKGNLGNVGIAAVAAAKKVSK